MATSQISSSTAMGFPKYPELPLELRLQIIEHAIKLFRRGSRAQLSAIHSEWNRIIEPTLFESITLTSRSQDSELAELGSFCGKRHKLLKYINIRAYNLGYREWQDDLLEFISQLFHTMKDWRLVDRRPDELIKLIIYVPTNGLPTGVDGNLEPIQLSSCDFENLPELSVIGATRISQGIFHDSVLHHSAMNSLYEKLPNLYSARLDFPCESSSQEIVSDSSNRMTALHTVKPNLTDLGFFQCDSLDHFRDQVGHRDRITITESLAPVVSLWSNSLVYLKVDTVMDIAQFLLTASNSVWPHLRRLKLRGFLDQYDEGLHGALDSKAQANSELLEGLVVALPSMPKLTKVDARVREPNGRCLLDWESVFRIDLDLRRGTESHGCVKPDPWCSKHPVVPCGSLPTSVGAIATAHFVTLPGSLVTELQAAVWKHRRLELVVFCCGGGEERGFSEPAPCCTTWNRKTDTWDPALMNDMDEFIYDMGQYLWQLDNDWKSEPDDDEW